MHRYPALVSGTGNGDASIATALNAAVKRGAAGCIGVAIDRRFGGGQVLGRDPEVADSAAIATLSEPGSCPGSQPIASHHSLVQPCSVVDGPSAELEPRGS